MPATRIMQCTIAGMPRLTRIATHHADPMKPTREANLEARTVRVGRRPMRARITFRRRHPHMRCAR
jgi:hypothetical protein